MGTETASVLFTDLVGSTELRSRLGEETADELRRQHDQLLTAAIADAGGTVVKSLGDGLMATFGSAADAVRGGVAIQQAVHDHADRNPDSAFLVRVGISTGDVSFEGDDCFGTPVVEASRLCATAVGGQILVADLVRAMARGRAEVVFEPIGELELKGLPEPVAACQVPWEPLAVSSGDEAVPYPPLLLGGATVPYVGRSDIVEQLDEAWARAQSGDGCAVLLAGEPGIGKTRTAAELARRAHARGAVVLYGRCDEELGVPYQPFVEALDWQTRHAPDLPLGRFSGELRRLVPELGDRVGDLPQAVSSDPRSEEFRLFESVASWLIEMSRPGGAVLVLDDLHWATKPTLLMLFHVLRSAASGEPPPRLLVVGTYRDTDVDAQHPLSAVLADLRRLPQVERILVDGLDADEVVAMVERAAGHELDEAELRLAHTTYRETEGNPFFLSEVLRHLVETGAVRLAEGRWVLTDPDAVMVPEGVREVVGRRLQRLSDAAGSVLSTAAVVGRDFHVDVLLPLADAGEGAVLDALDEAVRARLVEETGADRFRFSHALVRSTLYESLSVTRRRRMHRNVLDVLEKVRPDDVVALARHSVEGGPDDGDHSRAIGYALAAAEQALEARAVAEAETWFHQAFELLDDSDDPDPVQRVRALCGLGEAQRDQGNAQFRETLLTAGRAAAELDHTGLLVRAVLANSRFIPTMVGATDDEKVELLEAALAALGSERSPERALVLSTLATELVFDPASAIRRLSLVDEAESIARDLGDNDLIARVLALSVVVLGIPERMRALPGLLEEATQRADRSGDPVLRTVSRLGWGISLLGIGRFREAEAVLTEASQIAHEEGTPTLRWMVDSPRQMFELFRGDLDRAESLTNDLLELGTSVGEPDAVLWWISASYTRAYLRGRTGEMADAAGSAADEYPDAPVWRTAHVFALAEAGRHEEAISQLDESGLRDLGTIPTDFFYMAALAQLTLAATLLEDRALASDLVLALEPHRGLTAHFGLGVAGNVDFFIGLCLATMGEHEEAIPLLEAGVEQARGEGAPALAVRQTRFLVGVLLASGDPGHLRRARELAPAAVDEAGRYGLDGAAEELRQLAERAAATGA